MLGEFRKREALAKTLGKIKSGYFYMDSVIDFLARRGISAKSLKTAKKEIISLGVANA
jgi:hypothetical protein